MDKNQGLRWTYDSTKTPYPKNISRYSTPLNAWCSNYFTIGTGTYVSYLEGTVMTKEPSVRQAFPYTGTYCAG